MQSHELFVVCSPQMFSGMDETPGNRFHLSFFLTKSAKLRQKATRRQPPRHVPTRPAFSLQARVVELKNKCEAIERREAERRAVDERKRKEEIDFLKLLGLQATSPKPHDGFPWDERYIYLHGSHKNQPTSWIGKYTSHRPCSSHGSVMGFFKRLAI